MATKPPTRLHTNHCPHPNHIHIPVSVSSLPKPPIHPQILFIWANYNVSKSWYKIIQSSLGWFSYKVLQSIMANHGRLLFEFAWHPEQLTFTPSCVLDCSTPFPWSQGHPISASLQLSLALESRDSVLFITSGPAGRLQWWKPARWSLCCSSFGFVGSIRSMRSIGSIGSIGFSKHMDQNHPKYLPRKTRAVLHTACPGPVGPGPKVMTSPLPQDLAMAMRAMQEKSQMDLLWLKRLLDGFQERSQATA